MALKFWAYAPFHYGDMNQPWSEVIAEMLDIADAAEDLGYEGIVIPENHFQNYVSNPSSLGFASAVLSRTKRLKVQSAVLVLPYYNPLLLASEISMLDNMAPGRFNIGAARGGNRYPLDRINIDADEARGRYEESLEIMKRAWTEDDFSYEGQYFSFPKTTIVPKPATKPYPPISIAAQSTGGVAKVAQDGYNLITSPNLGNFEPHGDLASLMDTYNATAAASGHERGEAMVMRHVFIDQTEERAMRHFDQVVRYWNYYMATVKGPGLGRSKDERLAARTDDVQRDFIHGGAIEIAMNTVEPKDVFDLYDDPVITTPDRAIERFRHWESLGVDHAVLNSAMGIPIADVLENMRLTAAEVFPAFEHVAVGV